VAGVGAVAASVVAGAGAVAASVVAGAGAGVVAKAVAGAAVVAAGGNKRHYSHCCAVLSSGIKYCASVWLTRRSVAFLVLFY